MTDTRTPPALPLDTLLTEALEVVSDMLKAGGGPVQPEHVARLAAAAKDAKQAWVPRPEVVDVIFTQDGANLTVHENASWQEFDSLVPEDEDAQPGRCMRVGNVIVRLTPEGFSLLTVYRDVNAAVAVMDGLREQHEVWQAMNAKSDAAPLEFVVTPAEDEDPGDEDPALVPA